MPTIGQPLGHLNFLGTNTNQISRAETAPGIQNNAPTRSGLSIADRQLVPGKGKPQTTIETQVVVIGGLTSLVLIRPGNEVVDTHAHTHTCCWSRLKQGVC